MLASSVVVPARTKRSRSKLVAWILATGGGLQYSHQHSKAHGHKGNIRDEANGAQLVCLSNMESLNAEFIKQGMVQPERLRKLNAIAIEQMKILVDDTRTNASAGENNGTAQGLSQRPARDPRPGGGLVSLSSLLCRRAFLAVLQLAAAGGLI